MTLFNRNKGTNADYSALKDFLKNYPEEEFWRFFIERARYNYRENLYRELMMKLQGISEEDAKKIPLSSIQQIAENIKIQQLFDLAEQQNDEKLKTALLYMFHVQDRKDETVAKLIDRQQAWIGFEDNEPGYLDGISKSFRFVLESAKQGTKLTNQFIKQLHKECTQSVKNMIPQTSGEYREKGAAWQIDLAHETSPDVLDSREGLIENINYLKSVKEKFGECGVRIIVDKKELLDPSTSKSSEGFVDYISAAAKEGKFIEYEVSNYGGNILPSDFLDKLTELNIDDFNQAINKATSKEEKLTAIFTFLKRTVLHHPFQDGTGRTYSMMLIQFMLLKENLLPFVIKNSNMIPGVSVKEMVDEYLRGEKEMKMILKDPSFVSSSQFANNNVDTKKFLNNLDEKEKGYFQQCLNEFRIAKDTCLENLPTRRQRY